MKFIKKYLLEITVFVCGAVVMIFELAGTRLLAPYLGTSIYVWTSLIGVILGSLSLGYYFGGKLADKKPSFEIFSMIIFLSGILIFFTIVFNKEIFSLMAVQRKYIELYSFFAALVLFAPASVFLGIITPFAVKLKTKNLDTLASTVGNLYAISTIGSIFGTFLAGFLLIPFLGTLKILYSLSLILVVFSILNDFQNFKKIKIFSFAIILLFLIFFSNIYPINKAGKIIEIKDTQYNNIQIIETQYPLNGKLEKMNGLMIDPYGIQSGQFLNNNELAFEYNKMFNIFKHFNPEANSALMIGGAAYTYPRYFVDNFENAKIDVVEIDPGMLEVAKKYFSFKNDSRIKIFHEDGRIFLNNNQKKYDLIFNDAYNSFLAVPFQLSTREAVLKMRESLNDNGVLVANIISAQEGKRAEFLIAEYKTYKNIFPQVYLFATKKELSREIPQNIILIALKSKLPAELNSPDPKLNNYLSRIIDVADSDSLPVLTDDYCPVEYYKYKML